MSPKSMAPPAALLSREMRAPLYMLRAVKTTMLMPAGIHPSLHEEECQAPTFPIHQQPAVSLGPLPPGKVVWH